MKTTFLPPLLTLTIVLTSVTLSRAQYHPHGHGHGYGHYSSSYTPSYRPASTYRPTFPTSRPRPQSHLRNNTSPSAQRRAAADRQEAAQARYAEQQRQAAEALRERRAQRFAEVQQETMNALDRIAQQAAQNASRAVDTSLSASLDRISQDTAARQQQGFDCIVSQSGGMDCYRQPNMNAPVSYTGQQTIRVPEAYSGSLSGGGYNNPAVQNVRNNGPIPQGNWSGTEVRQRLHGNPHSNVIALQSAPDNDRQGRDNDFLIHGDSRSRPGDASEGCVIAPPDVRQTLAEMLNAGGQIRLDVRH